MSAERKHGARAPEAPAFAAEREQIVPGAGVARHPLYSAPITRQGWPAEMLQAVAVAKRLGVTRFEIDVQGDVFARPQQQRPPQGWITIMPSYPTDDDDGDEWQAGSPAKSGGAKEPVPTITVYAVVVE